MLRALALVALASGFAAAANAQSAGAYSRSALATIGAAQGAAGGYRVAARTGVSAPTGSPSMGSFKPFAGATTSSSSTVSPYLNLFRDDVATGAPNYYTFVRPQMDQEEANRRQFAQLQQLQRQVQQASFTTPTTPATGMSGGARYGYTGSYFGLRR